MPGHPRSMITTTERRFPVRLIQESDRLIQTRRWRAMDSNHQPNAYARNLYLYLAKTVLSQTDAIPSAATSPVVATKVMIQAVASADSQWSIMFGAWSARVILPVGELACAAKPQDQPPPQQLRRRGWDRT